MDNEMLSIGQMAKLHHVSEKALRIYHKCGILVPEVVNEQTGYRFYSLLQSAQLDMILQMQAVGFSLHEIRTILDNKDIEYLKSCLGQKLTELEQERYRLRLVQHSAERLLNTCRIFEAKPDCTRFAIVKLPARRILRFQVAPYTLGESSAKAAQNDWERAIRTVKEEFLRRSLPLPLFHNVGCIVSKADLMEGVMCISGAFILIDDELAGSSADWIPAGTYITKLCDSLTDSAGGSREPKFLKCLLREAAALGYQVVGEYYGEVLAETPAFLFEGRDTMVRMQIQIDTDIVK